MKSVFLLLLLVGTATAQVQLSGNVSLSGNTSTTALPPVPKDFFGFNSNACNSSTCLPSFAEFHYGLYRGWDCASCLEMPFLFQAGTIYPVYATGALSAGDDATSGLDFILRYAKTNGLTVMLELGRTPPQFSSGGDRCVGPGNPDISCTKAANHDCQYDASPGAGQCDLAYDVATTDNDYKSRVAALVNHIIGLNSSHVTSGIYYIPWNEFNIATGYDDTTDNMLKLVYDAATTIHAIDSRAKVSSANTVVWIYPSAQGVATFQGFQFADTNVKSNVDAVSAHGYMASNAETGQFPCNPGPAPACNLGVAPPEELYAMADDIKLNVITFGNYELLLNEDSWGQGNNNAFTDKDQRIAYFMRKAMLAWSAGFRKYVWYKYDDNHLHSTALTTASVGGDADCSGGAAIGATGQILCPVGTAFQRLYDLIVGATLTTPFNGPRPPHTYPTPAGSWGLWSGQFTKSDGSQLLVMWDTDPAYGCSGGVCTTHNVTVFGPYTKYSVGESSATTVLAGCLTGCAVPIGMKPVFIDTTPNTGPTLTSIAVTPASSDVAIGATKTMTATGTFSDGTTADVTSSSVWTSGNTALLTVASNVATGVAVGSTTVSATNGTITGSTSLAVTTSFATLTGSTSSECSGVNTPTIGCNGAFAGLSTTASNTNAQTQIPVPAPGPVSSLSLHTLMYAGWNGSMICEIQPWFYNIAPYNGHINVKMNMNSVAQLTKQLSYMKSIGCDVVSPNYYGVDSSQAFNFTTVSDIIGIISANPTLYPKFTILADKGMLSANSDGHGCSTSSATTACLIAAFEYQFNYINTQGWFAASWWLKDANGHPIIELFNPKSGWPASVNWTGTGGVYPTLKAYTDANYVGHTPVYIDEFGAFGENGIQGQYGWMQPPVYNNSSNGGLSCTGAGCMQFCWDTVICSPTYSYSNDFYQQAKSHPTEIPIGLIFARFDWSNASWKGSTEKILAGQCANVWLATATKAAANGYSTSLQMPFMHVATWNDKEEGHSIESGVQNCFTVSAAMASAPTFTFALNKTDVVYASTSTIDHLRVWRRTGDKTFLVQDNLATGSTSLNLLGATYPVPAGTWTVTVEAVGKAGIQNHMSNDIIYTH